MISGKEKKHGYYDENTTTQLSQMSILQIKRKEYYKLMCLGT